MRLTKKKTLFPARPGGAETPAPAPAERRTLSLARLLIEAVAERLDLCTRSVRDERRLAVQDAED